MGSDGAPNQSFDSERVVKRIAYIAIVIPTRRSDIPLMLDSFMRRPWYDKIQLVAAWAAVVGVLVNLFRG